MNFLKVFVGIIISVALFALCWLIWEELPSHLRGTPLWDFRTLTRLLLMFFVLSMFEFLISTKSTQTEPKYAGFWPRVGAAMLDSLLLAVPYFVVGWIFSFNIGYNIAIDFEIMNLTVIVWDLIWFLIGYLYFAILESSSLQASLGKRVFSLKVIDFTGERISFMRATGRYFGKFVSGISFLIGFLMIGWTEKRQGLHDKMARTLVIINS